MFRFSSIFQIPNTFRCSQRFILFPTFLVFFSQPFSDLHSMFILQTCSNFSDISKCFETNSDVSKHFQMFLNIFRFCNILNEMFAFPSSLGVLTRVWCSCNGYWKCFLPWGGESRANFGLYCWENDFYVFPKTDSLCRWAMLLGKLKKIPKMTWLRPSKSWS